MEAITIDLMEEHGIQHKSEAFQLGVPIAKGCLPPQTPVSLIDTTTSEELTCQVRPLASWPDGSVRWLKLEFLGDLQPGERRTLELQLHPTSPQPASSPFNLTRSRNGLNIDTGGAQFQLPVDGPGWKYIQGGESVHHTMTLTGTRNQSSNVTVDDTWKVVDHGPVSLSCVLEGWFNVDNFPLARYHCELTFYRDSKTVKVRTGIHNPRRARHPGGVWDLGDSGSIYFDAMAIAADIPAARRASIGLAPGKAVTQADTGRILLYQDSSGGENWNSLNHVNAEGNVTPRFRGYQLSVDDEIQASGDRATPFLAVDHRTTTIQATLPHFWQNFPSSLSVRADQLVVGLFPAEAADPYELQGGERKTQTAYFHYGEEQDALAWTLAPVIPVLDADHYEKSSAFSWFSARTTRGQLDELIQQGLDGPSNFFAKREIIDEYGWRNFGDIFADHETFYQKDDEPPLISHYNNQYDAIYGFARQFALTGDKRWYELMDDLATHVQDIDIYHTDEDRPEYNHGLFWHTDHYLPAHTATHRTYSRHNDSSSIPGQTGGGPAKEHCYTTGLLYHYFLTGDTASRDAVIELADWIHVLHEGSLSLLGTLLKIKRRDIPDLTDLLAGQVVHRHRYVLNRGTGNYLNAMIDAHLADPSGAWLERAASIIVNTINPADRIQLRNLLTVKKHWSYTVFLTAVARYLLVKGESGDFDRHYHYAWDSFCHYTRWMVRHERPFSIDPKDLSYPYRTWVAQEIRKSMLLFLAAKFDPEYESDYLDKAHFFLTHVTRLLSECETKEKTYSRPLSILLQNYGPQGLDSKFRIPVPDRKAPMGRDQDSPLLTIPSLFNRTGVRLKNALLNFNPAKEKAWLQRRLEKPQH